MNITFDVTAARAFLDMLGDSATVFDFRAIHDKDRSAQGIPMRGTLEQVAAQLQYWNERDHGIFVVINETDGAGLSIANVKRVRAQFVDLDKGDVAANYARAMAWDLKPSGTVVSSAGRAHVYWSVKPYDDLIKFSEIQRKLITLFGGDPPVFDAPRVMRLPGSWHLKAEPFQVAYYPNAGAPTYDVGAFEWSLAGVTADSGGGDRNALGSDATLLAPSLEWATYALNKIDPRELDRAEWLKLTAAFKAAAWASGDPVARLVWDIWCSKYPDNNIPENDKLWRSIGATKTGWNYLMRTAGIEAEFRLGSVPLTMPASGEAAPAAPPTPAAVAAPAGASGPAILSPRDQFDYFKGCMLIKSLGLILAPDGRLYDPSKFNAAFGGKMFVLDDVGKVTDEPWKAATRGQIFQVSKIDAMRFLPTMEPGMLVADEFGRLAVNTYKPPVVDMVAGDVQPFLKHLHALLPNERDVRIVLSFLAHNVQRPGRKVFWAILIQSTQGAGKGVIKLAMEYALGQVYIHGPNPKELVESGGKFTGWMRQKLLIIADEIKIDDKRDMLEVLKPMITEERIEIQGKGADQVMDDNVANWVMFTNYKDAIPITNNDRRYSVFYSPIQNAADLVKAGMDGDYFPKLYAWLKGDGKKHVAYFLKHYPIDPEFDPIGNAHRAPITSSTAEAIIQSRGRIEQAIVEAVEDAATGFRNGWLSSVIVGRMMVEKRMQIGPHALKKAFEGLGYNYIGRSTRGFMQEDGKQPHLYNLRLDAKIADYAVDQGYGKL